MLNTTKINSAKPYCELKIESSKKLELHRRKCHVLSDFPCDQCGAQCKNIDDLGRHRTSYHGLWIFSDDHGQERFWCDICNVNHLRTHVKEFHTKQRWWMKVERFMDMDRFDYNSINDWLILSVREQLEWICLREPSYSLGNLEPHAKFKTEVLIQEDM